MKKTVLFKSFRKIVTATFLTMGLLVSAQTISPVTALPTSSEVGSSPSLNFNYTASEACKIRVDLWIVNVDGNGVITNPYDAYKAGNASATLPATAIDIQQAVTVSLPGNLGLSSSLPAGKTYAWDYKILRASDDGYLIGNQVATTILASSSVVDGIVINSPPTTISAGSTITISVDYTLSGPRLIKFGISKFSSSGAWINDLVGTGVDNLPATTTTPVTLTQDLMIPSNAIASANLTNGEYYKVDTAIFTPGYASYIMGTNSNITVTGALGIENFSESKFRISPNPVSNKLYLNKEFKKITIYDITGKKILQSIPTSDNSIDVSRLKKGMYILISDTNQKVKFLKE
jgi:hypothetical protein